MMWDEIKWPVFGVILMIVVGVWGIVVSNKRSAEIYNKQYGTNYSAMDFFLADDAINAISKKVHIEQ